MTEQAVSSILVQRYSIAVDEVLTVGRPRKFAREFAFREAFEKDNIKRFRLSRPCTNVHVPGFIYLTEVSFSDGLRAPANIIGGDPVDAWKWSPEAVGVYMDTKDIGPEHNVIVKGYITHLVPAPFHMDLDFKFMLSMTGPINEAIRDIRLEKSA